MYPALFLRHRSLPAHICMDLTILCTHKPSMTVHEARTSQHDAGEVLVYCADGSRRLHLDNITVQENSVTQQRHCAPPPSLIASGAAGPRDARAPSPVERPANRVSAWRGRTRHGASALTRLLTRLLAGPPSCGATTNHRARILRPGWREQERRGGRSPPWREAWPRATRF